MRIQFEFEIERLPIAYRLGILSILKEMIRKGSNSYYKQLFENNRERMKPFSYATYFPNLQLENGEIVTKRLLLTVSSDSYDFMMHLLNGSGRREEYSYQNYKLQLLHKRLLPNPPTFSSIVMFRTLSPILFERKDKKPVLANDSDFEKEWNYHANLLLRELENRNLYQPMKILHSSMKKVVVKENLHQNQDQPLFITANQGYVQVQGDPEDLRILYDLGIGRRRSLGFGLLEVEEVVHT